MQGSLLITSVNTIAERLKWARAQRGMTQAQLAAAARVSTSAIGNVESGIRERPRDLLDIARALRASPTWLESGRGTWDDAPDSNVSSAPAAMQPRRYPVISSVQAGEWSEIVDNFQPGDAEDWQDSPVDLGPNGFILKLEGNSMTNPAGGKDNFPEGMYVHVHPGIEAQPGDYVIAKREHENKATFKKLVRVDGEQYLHAINPAWPKPYIKLEPGDKIIGKLKFAGWSF